MITIKEFEENLTNEIIQLNITELQKNYVHIDFYEILEMACEYSDTHLYAIYNDNIIIGLACFVLDEAGDMNLYKFMLDYHYQGKGHGNDALVLLLGLIKPLTARGEVWLSVHPQNAAAIALYRKAGFIQQRTQFDADDEMFFKYTY